jgi:hypothetical protein
MYAKQIVVLKVSVTTLSYTKVSDIFNTCIKNLNTVNLIFKLKYSKVVRRT